MCPNCKNWNESYRNQVPCHRCKNTRQVLLPGCEICKSSGKCRFCKGSKICDRCKGKGYLDTYVNLKGSNLVKLPKPNDSSTNDSNSGQVKVVKNIFIFPDVKDNQPGYVSPEQNIVDCKDFPFELGCVNDVIGDINERFFGKGHRRANVFTKELLRALVSSALIDTDDKNPKITQEIYERILKNSKKDIIKE